MKSDYLSLTMTSPRSKRFLASSFRKLAREQKIGIKGEERGEKEGLLPSHSPFFNIFVAIFKFRAIIQLRSLVTQANHDHLISGVDKS